MDGPKPGSWNMALDEVLLGVVSNLDLPRTYLRLYEWDSPTLSLGFSQRPGCVVDFAFCSANQIGVIKRITGGKAVLHHEEITYSVISNDSKTFPSKSISGTYRCIAQALSLGLRHLGLETHLAMGESPRNAVSRLSNACFAVSNRHEILCQGRKLVGSAQRKTKNAFIQHGSILLNFNPLFLSGATKDVSPQELMSKVTCLSSCLGHLTGRLEVIHCLSQGFRDAFGVNFELDTPSHHLRELADGLARSKYANLNSQNHRKWA